MLPTTSSDCNRAHPSKSKHHLLDAKGARFHGFKLRKKQQGPSKFAKLQAEAEKLAGTEDSKENKGVGPAQRFFIPMTAGVGRDAKKALVQDRRDDIVTKKLFGASDLTCAETPATTRALDMTTTEAPAERDLCRLLHHPTSQGDCRDACGAGLDKPPFLMVATEPDAAAFAYDGGQFMSPFVKRCLNTIPCDTAGVPD